MVVVQCYWPMSAGSGNLESLREISMRRHFLSEKLLEASYSNNESIVFGALVAVQVGGDDRCDLVVRSRPWGRRDPGSKPDSTEDPSCIWLVAR
ncbi:hypothetical protein AVEN_182670-1 [Araneus ventricosus]|uniref:Uncharacterized protein n=1 Tax=Araneus ventricosus TaxID=182803 RepID=A0A4Y2L9Q9_ARAVE|nr:hypothetical protein AVEN_182670-1 [Araneus ventricosus]